MTSSFVHHHLEHPRSFEEVEDDDSPDWCADDEDRGAAAHDSYLGFNRHARPVSLPARLEHDDAAINASDSLGPMRRRGRLSSTSSRQRSENRVGYQKHLSYNLCANRAHTGYELELTGDMFRRVHLDPWHSLEHFDPQSLPGLHAVRLMDAAIKNHDAENCEACTMRKHLRKGGAPHFIRLTNARLWTLRCDDSCNVSGRCQDGFICTNTQIVAHLQNLGWCGPAVNLDKSGRRRLKCRRCGESGLTQDALLLHLLVVPHGNEEDDEDDNNDDDEEKEKEHLDADERKGCRARMVTNTSHPAHHHAHHELEDVINGSMRMDLSTDVTTLSVDTLSYASPTCTAQPAPPLNLTFTTIASGNMSALVFCSV